MLLPGASAKVGSDKARDVKSSILPEAFPMLAHVQSILKHILWNQCVTCFKVPQHADGPRQLCVYYKQRPIKSNRCRVSEENAPDL